MAERNFARFDCVEPCTCHVISHRPACSVTLLPLSSAALDASSIMAVENDRHRTIVYQFDFHMKAKPASFNFNTTPAGAREQVFIQFSGLFGRRRIDERWPALAGVGMQSKLRNNEQFSANSAQREVHFARLIREHS